MNPTRPSLQEEQEQARAAMRGDAAYLAIGYEDPKNAPAPPTAEATLLHQVINIAAAGTHTLIAVPGGQRFHIVEMMLYTDTQMNLELKDGDTSITGPLNNWPANTGFFWQDTGVPHYSGGQGSPLKLVTGALGQVSGFVRYRMA